MKEKEEGSMDTTMLLGQAVLGHLWLGGGTKKSAVCAAGVVPPECWDAVRKHLIRSGEMLKVSGFRNGSRYMVNMAIVNPTERGWVTLIQQGEDIVQHYQKEALKLIATENEGCLTATAAHAVVGRKQWMTELKDWVVDSGLFAIEGERRGTRYKLEVC